MTSKKSAKFEPKFSQMKNLLFSIFALFAIAAFAQNQIRVEYEVQPFYNPADKNSGFEMTFLNSNYELITDGNESQFDYIEKIRNEQPAQDGFSMSVEMRSEGTLYKNISENLILEESGFDSKPYLIKDTLPEIDWKISRETKEVAGISTQKATAVLNDKHKTQVIAWYAPKLNFKNGPDKFWGLPGLILELETHIDYPDGGSEGNLYKATKVEVPEKNLNIRRPAKGKEISQSDYDKMVEKQNQKLMDMYGVGVEKD